MDTPADLVIHDDIDCGRWMHQKLTEAFGHETEAWAVERVARITDRLNRVRAQCSAPGACPYPLHATILWVGEMNAFAAPGEYIYVTRELLQRAATDDPIAFVLAHEMAHHDLGHVRLVSGWAKGIRRLPGSVLLGALLQRLRHATYGPEREAAADTYALDLCLAAGFDGRLCLDLFPILEAHLLDHGDLDGVFGIDSGTSWWEATRQTLHRKARGYPPLRERRAALEQQLAAYGA